MALSGLNPFSLAGRQRAPVAGGMDVKRMLAAAKTTPELSMLEWEGDQEEPALDSAADSAADDPRDFPPRRRRIRDRYIAARFPGIVRGAADLNDVAAVVKSARLHFEDQRPDLALELLGLAIEEIPLEAALWLARLEILFLARDTEGFVATARAFREVHAGSAQWPEVERLGRVLAPAEALFAGKSGWKPNETYGPWPHMPNWIQASWDLTAEVMAADFHRAMR